MVDIARAGFDFDTSMIDRALGFVSGYLRRPNIDTPAWQLNRQVFYLYPER